MTEEIIIDGVNVAGCTRYNKDTGYCKGGFKPEEEPYCQCFTCEYKQRLEQIVKADNKQIELDAECIANYVKEVKKLKQENEMIINEYNKLQAEIIGDMEFKEIMLTGITPLKVLQNLKERNRELQAFYDVHESFKTDFDTNRKLLDTYRSVLEEIRKLTIIGVNASLCNCGLRALADDILDKINEVLK